MPGSAQPNPADLQRALAAALRDAAPAADPAALEAFARRLAA